jgi:gamma-glutamylcyclotransferase (GGCT)/AIG2-like uncharacterized protein YtfP
MKTSKEKHWVHVFVYGSLKKHLGNYGYIREVGGEFIGYDTISGPFTMVSLGGFPAVCHDSSIKGADPVYGQIFRVPPDGLNALDALEGHPRWYKREKMRTDYHDMRAWVYLMPESEIGNRPPVQDNMWRCASDEAAFWQTKGDLEPEFDVEVKAS